MTVRYVLSRENVIKDDEMTITFITLCFSIGTFLCSLVCYLILNEKFLDLNARRIILENRIDIFEREYKEVYKNDAE
jgi:hypothetical protein